MNGQGGYKVWSWIWSGSCWLSVGEGSRDAMIIQLRQRREAAARIMASARFVLTEPDQSPDQAFAADPHTADMPPPLRTDPPSSPMPWDPGYRPADATTVITLQELLAERDAEIARLRGQLDFYLGRNVIHCMSRNAPDAMASLLTEGDGTLLRSTDTDQEWELRGGAWLPTR